LFVVVVVVWCYSDEVTKATHDGQSQVTEVVSIRVMDYVMEL